MEANPSKFQGILKVYGDTVPPKSITVANVEISFDNIVVLLGVDIDVGLTFDMQISKICKRSASSLHAIGRLARYLTVDCRKYLYNAFVASNLSYCNIVWHYCGIQNIVKMEKINRRALRIVLNDDQSSYAELLEKVGHQNLYTVRRNAIALEVFKCKREVNPAFLHDMFVSLEHNYNLRRFAQFEPPLQRTKIYGTDTFVYQGAIIWNKVPLSAKCAESITEFKAIMRALPPEICACNMYGCIICRIANL